MKHSLENFLLKAWFEVREWHWVPTTMLCSVLTRLGISYLLLSRLGIRPIITPRPFSSSSSPRVICCDPPDYLSPHHGSVFVSLPGVLWLFVKIISIRWPRVQNHHFSTTSMSRDAVEGFRPSVCVFNKLNVRQGDILDDPSGRLRYEARININKWLGHDDPTRPWQ